jgi:hypothetical protein
MQCKINILVMNRICQCQELFSILSFQLQLLLYHHPSSEYSSTVGSRLCHPHPGPFRNPDHPDQLTQTPSAGSSEYQGFNDIRIHAYCHELCMKSIAMHQTEDCVRHSHFSLQIAQAAMQIIIICGQMRHATY